MKIPNKICIVQENISTNFNIIYLSLENEKISKIYIYKSQYIFYA